MHRRVRVLSSALGLPTYLGAGGEDDLRPIKSETHIIKDGRLAAGKKQQNVVDIISRHQSPKLDVFQGQFSCYGVDLHHQHNVKHVYDTCLCLMSI